jgi:hypothetical protein
MSSHCPTVTRLRSGSTSLPRQYLPACTAAARDANPPRRSRERSPSRRPGNSTVKYQLPCPPRRQPRTPRPIPTSRLRIDTPAPLPHTELRHLDTSLFPSPFSQFPTEIRAACRVTIGGHSAKVSIRQRQSPTDLAQSDFAISSLDEIRTRTRMPRQDLDYPAGGTNWPVSVRSGALQSDESPVLGVSLRTATVADCSSEAMFRPYQQRELTVPPRLRGEHGRCAPRGHRLPTVSTRQTKPNGPQRATSE